MTKSLLILLLLIHGMVSFVAFSQVGILTVFPPFEEAHTYQIFSDLLVSISLTMMFIYRELKRKQRPLKAFYACCVGVVLLGSFAPVIYLLWDREVLQDP